MTLALLFHWFLVAVAGLSGGSLFLLFVIGPAVVHDYAELLCWLFCVVIVVGIFIGSMLLVAV